MNCIKYFRLLFISLFCFISTIAHSFEVDGINYSITSSTTVSVASNKNCSGAIIIPEKVTYNGKEYSVTSINYEAFKGCSLTSVTIGKSVTSIGQDAFMNCSSLTAVNITDLSAWCKINFNNYNSNPTNYAHHLYLNGEEITNLVIPDDVTSIGNWAFNGCSSITSLTILNSVTSIGDYAFNGCSGLKSVTIGNSVTSIGKGAFVYCSGLTSIDIPNSVTSIGSYAFEYCFDLTSVTIPNSVTSIGEGTFYGCSGMTSVTIPNSVTSIGDQAFERCYELTSVTIPNSVTSIGYSAFGDCSGMTAVHITDLSAWCKITFGRDTSNPTYYARHLYLNGEKITNLVIPDDIPRIGNYAFINCSGLTSVTIPNSVTSIEWQAFYGCSGLTSVTIPNSVTSIGDQAFEGCSGLTSVTIPNSVTSIGHSAFSGCSGMTSVTIPNSVTSIEWQAFYGCSGLTSVTIPNSVTSIESSAFGGCSGLTSVTIPNSVTSIESSAFQGCSGLTSVTIPNSVTSIGYSAFYGCSGLTSITIPNSVTSIGNYAFYGCSRLTSVTIPNSVTSIGSEAFYKCSDITEVHISDLSAWYKIKFGDEYANPMYNSSWEVTYVNDVELIDLTIPDSITSISENAFRGCSSLRRLTIPESCKTVPQYAFEKCNNLQELTLPSTCIACYNYSFNGCTSLKKINCQAETPPVVYANTFSSSIYTKATLNVPEGSADKYKAASFWKKFTNMTVGGSELKQCAAPVITYADGKLQFACETEGAEYRYTLTDTDIKSVYTDVTNSAVNLSACYTIKAYAYADGYTNSEQVTATLYWINGSDVSTNINQTEMRGVMATCSGGIITVSGLTDGETVMFYDANGALLYTGTAQNGTISYAPSTSGVIIVKIGTTSIKVVS